jgi:Protein of unknown function (DUF3455)
VKLPKLHVVATLGCAALAHPLAALAQTHPAPEALIPASLRAPEHEKVILRSHATGWQIYTCAAGGEGKPQWTLKAPDADLHDPKGAVIGHHFAGPTWKYSDGSEVKGKPIAHLDSPDPKSIPWLLLTATDHSGDGLFSRVTSIQRLNTQGGQPPAATGCDAAKVNSEARSSYTADYYFYAPEK